MSPQWELLGVKNRKTSTGKGVLKGPGPGTSARIKYSSAAVRRVQVKYPGDKTLLDVMSTMCHDATLVPHDHDGKDRMAVYSQAYCVEVYQGYQANKRSRGFDGLIVSGKKGWKTVAPSHNLDAVADLLVRNLHAYRWA